MDELPNEILVGILKRLTNIDLNICADVCQHWKDVIFDAIGVTRYIGIPQDYFSAKYKNAFVDLKEIGETGMHSCVISNLDGQNLPNFRSGYLTKNFQIFGALSISNYNKLMTPLENLTGLSLHVSALTTFKFGDGGAMLKFPKLKRFILSGDKTMLEEFMASLPTHDVLRSNLATFLLDIHFPKLQTLNVCEVPLMSANHDTDLVDALVFFAVRHSATLRTFQFTNCNQLINPGTIPVIPLLETNDINANQLNTCNVLIHHHEGPQIQEKFYPIIAAQTSLRNFLAMSGTFCPILIGLNSSTLVRLDLNVKFEPNQVIDFQALAPCSSLKALTLIGGMDDASVITNTKFLVSSMESIRLVGFKLSTADASALAAKNWKMLKYLELQYIGIETDFGVTFGSICDLLKLRKIIHVFISNGINKDSFAAAKESCIKVSMPELAAELLGHFIPENPLFELNLSLGYDRSYIHRNRAMGRKYYIPEGSDQMYIKDIEVYPLTGHLAFGVGMLL